MTNKGHSDILSSNLKFVFSFHARNVQWWIFLKTCSAFPKLAGKYCCWAAIKRLWQLWSTV